MSSRRILPFLLPLLVGLLLGGCSNEDGHLSVEGSATLELSDGTTTGFDFGQRTRLQDDRVTRYDRVAGHCTIGLGVEGERDLLSVGLTRPIDDADQGVRELRIVAQDPGVGFAEGTVDAQLLGRDWTASGGAGCDIEVLYLQSDDGLAALEVDCTLSDADGQTAQATAELYYEGCVIENAARD